MKITKSELENFVNNDERFTKECPRCGEKLGRYPALSRHADVNICSDCGTAEAFMDVAGCPVDFTQWNLGRRCD